MTYEEILDLAFTQAVTLWSEANRLSQEMPENRILHAREKRRWEQVKELEAMLLTERKPE